jgi:hypothetical protein
LKHQLISTMSMDDSYQFRFCHRVNCFKREVETDETPLPGVLD